MAISRSSKTINKSAIDKNISELKKLPPKPKDVFGLRDAINEMYSDIQSVISKGYSYDEVAALLSKGGIEIKGVTLKQYLADYRRRTKKGTVSKSKKVESDSPVSAKSTEVTEAVIDKEKPSQDIKRSPKSGGSVDGFVGMPDEL